MDGRWVVPVVFISVFAVVFLVATSNVGLAFTNAGIAKIFTVFPRSTVLSASPSSLPRLAYLVSGARGDVDKLWRVLQALYHPRNYYVVHLDREAPDAERAELDRRLREQPVFREVGNVVVISPANMVTYRGPTMVANTLHACALLLRKWTDWDWFINLSASDYPLMTQDDILQVFSSLPRNLSFVEHTSDLGWKASQRGKPLVIDPGLYKSNKSDLFWVTETRELPTAFRLFTGSAWTALGRSFVEYCVWGWDNLPRTLLMYYTNFVSSPEGYFQTLICNVPDYAATAVNHDLHHIRWDVPPRQHPRVLTLADSEGMVRSNAPFARKFARGAPVLDWVDAHLLRRPTGGFTPGGWCQGEPPCSAVGDVARLRPRAGARRLEKLVDRIVRSNSFSQNQCK